LQGEGGRGCGEGKGEERSHNGRGHTLGRERELGVLAKASGQGPYLTAVFKFLWVSVPEFESVFLKVEIPKPEVDESDTPRL
jgi:hypothetical protein